MDSIIESENPSPSVNVAAVNETMSEAEGVPQSTLQTDADGPVSKEETAEQQEKQIADEPSNTNGNEILEGTDTRAKSEEVEDVGTAETSVPVDTQPAAEENKDTTVQISQDVLQQIEKDFADIQSAESDAEDFLKRKEEYTRIYNALQSSLKNEAAVKERISKVEFEIEAQKSQVQSAIKLGQNDRATINNLRKDIKKAWEMVQEAREREERAKEIIQQLRAEINVLEQALEQTNSAEEGNEQNVATLTQQKEELTRERDMQLNQITQLRLEISEVSESTKHLEKMKEKNEFEISKLKNEIVEKKMDGERERKIKEKLERDLKDAKAALEQKNGEIWTKNENLVKLKEEVAKYDIQLREQKSLLERATKDQEQLQYKAAKLQQDYDDQLNATTLLVADNQAKSADLKAREEEVNRLYADIKKMTRDKDVLQSRFRTLEEQKRVAEADRDQLKAVKNSLEKDIEALKRQLETEKRHLEELSREKDIIAKNLQKSHNATNKQVMLVKIQEQSQRNLEQDIAAYKEEAAKQRKIIYSLEKEREKFVLEASTLQKSLTEGVEILKVKETEIGEYKKSIVEIENKLKQQQNLYEAVRTDRNNYSKALIEAQDEMSDMKRKLKTVTHQIDQLKDEIHSKESLIEKHETDLRHAEKDKERLKIELQKLKTHAETAEKYFQHQQMEEQKLRVLVQEAETELANQKRDYEQVLQERNVINGQVVKREEEINLLSEKIKIQQSILQKGELQYRDRLDDIRALKLEIENLRHEKASIENELKDVHHFKSEIVRLEKDVMKEKSRVKILENQLQSPVNIHRWRKLEATNPDSMELIQKVQALQKRLITKTEEIIEKELIIQQKEKLYEQLKVILARQPGPEIVEEVGKYQHELKEKTIQLKSMKSELQMYQTQVNQSKFEIERLNREMLNMKKVYFEEKRKGAMGPQSRKIKGNKNNHTVNDALDLALQNSKRSHIIM